MKKVIIRLLMFSFIILMYLPQIAMAGTVAGMPVTNDVNSSVLGAGGKIYGLAIVIGIGVATTMLVVLAIKYMGSSTSEKAEIKKHAVVYVVGACCIYASSGIIAIIQAFAEGFNQ